MNREKNRLAMLGGMFAIALLQGCSTHGVEGWHVVANVVIDSDVPARASTSTMSADVANDKFRLRMSSTALRRGADTIDMIVDSAAGTIISVESRSRVANLMNSVTANDEGSVPMKMELAVNPNYTVEDLGSGGAILGLATHHYRETLMYTTRVTIAGEACAKHTKSVTESWVATASDAPDVAATLQRLSSGVNSEMQRDVQAKLAMAEATRPKGARLRQIAMTNEPSSGSDSLTHRTEWNVVEMEHRKIPAADFEVPKGFQVIDLRKQAPANAAAQAAPSPDVVARMRKRLCGKNTT